VNQLWPDLRYALRALRQRPGFTIIAVLTIALGIGANTAIFSVVNGVLLRGLPYPSADRIVLAWEASDTSRNIHLSYPNFNDWRNASQSFSAFSGHTGRWGGESTVVGGNEPERAYSVLVFKDFFTVFAVAPVVGRTFLPEESRFGAPAVAVISYGFWQRRLGGAADLSGRRLSIDGTTVDVVGVMPPSFSYPVDTDLWILREPLVSDETMSRSSHNFVGVARLKDGVTLAQAQAEMKAIGARIAQSYPNDDKGHNPTLIPLLEQMVGGIRTALMVLLGAVGFVLLIACANVANLLLARSLARSKEIAVRAALGASRGRLIRQLLTESLLLAVLGGVAGLMLAYWLVQLLIAIGPATIPRLGEVHIDGRALSFTAALVLLASFLFGLVPALRVSRPDLNEALKEGGLRVSSSAGVWRQALVVAQVALTLMLLVGASLLGRSFWRLLQVDPGFRPTGALTVQLGLPSSSYATIESVAAFHERLQERLRSIAGVESAGLINNLPMAGVDINGSFAIEGRPPDKSGYGGFRITSPDYFRAMQIPILRGRAFLASDRAGAEPVALISERLAATAFPQEDPIGKRVRSTMDGNNDQWMRIVGVVGNVRHYGLERRGSADLYVPYLQRPRRSRDATLIVRTSIPPETLIQTIREEVHRIDPQLPLTFETMERIFDRTIATRRYNMFLLGAFAVTALTLALIGVYGVMSYTVAQNTREIGIRLALGAEARHILRIVVGQGAFLAGVGIVVGILGTAALTRLMATLLFEVGALDPLSFSVVPVLLMFVTLAACYLPARRATRVDPLVALKCD
jgi:putative ABC transport system permease protein